MENREIKDIEDIDTSTLEGKLLLMALARLNVKLDFDKTSSEIIAELNNLFKQVDTKIKLR